jgi:steroid 5-alpha reductase family enzyme
MGVGDRARVRGLSWVAVAYLVAAIAGFLVAWVFARHHSLVLAVAAGDVAATVTVFGFSAAFDNSSFYDLYWSIAPMVIAVGLLLSAPHDAPSTARRVLVVLLVQAWGARLSWHWIRSWPGVQHEDFRYVDLRAKTKSVYWVVSFFGLHLFPTVITFLGGLAMFAVFSTGRDDLNVIDVAAAVIVVGAIVLEGIADEQLRRFRRDNPVPGRIMAGGLWALCRHPNYVGEMMFWWGLALFGVAADAGAWWVLLGPVSVTALIAGISVRMIDARSLARRPGYAEHMKNVPAFFPRIFR